ncbi:MAG: hypothetical protein M1831_003727 [Alyxoria varia]|nr:MAG: hypothetical protein M1831_003727 [Alyxoria varia]
MKVIDRGAVEDDGGTASAGSNDNLTINEETGDWGGLEKIACRSQERGSTGVRRRKRKQRRADRVQIQTDRYKYSKIKTNAGVPADFFDYLRQYDKPYANTPPRLFERALQHSNLRLHVHNIVPPQLLYFATNLTRTLRHPLHQDSRDQLDQMWQGVLRIVRPQMKGMLNTALANQCDGEAWLAAARTHLILAGRSEA